MKTRTAVSLVLGPLLLSIASTARGQAVDIGSRRELFVDRLLIDRMDGVALRLHRPIKTTRPKSPLPEHHYITVIQDEDHNGELFRAYWRETDPDFPGPFHTGHAGEIVCYAESRDGHEWSFPKLGLHEVGGTRENNVALNVVPTGPTEMSIYHRSGNRYVLRTDGFVSVNAGSQTGELITHPLIFSGKELHLNLSTSAVGLVRIEIQDDSGNPIPGFTLEDCPTVYGDGIDLAVQWNNGRDLSSLSGKPVKIRFLMKECDLFSFQFQ